MQTTQCSKLKANHIKRKIMLQGTKFLLKKSEFFTTADLKHMQMSNRLRFTLQYISSNSKIETVKIANTIAVKSTASGPKIEYQVLIQIH